MCAGSVFLIGKEGVQLWRERPGVQVRGCERGGHDDAGEETCVCLCVWLAPYLTQLLFFCFFNN